MLFIVCSFSGSVVCGVGESAPYVASNATVGQRRNTSSHF